MSSRHKVISLILHCDSNVEEDVSEPEDDTVDDQHCEVSREEDW